MLLIKRPLFIKCIYYTFKILGVSTMSLDSRHLGNKLSPFKPSRCGILYNIILMIIVIILASLCYTALTDTTYPGRINLDSFVDIVQGAFTILTCEIILLTFSIQQGKTITIAENLLSVVKRLSNTIDGEKDDKLNVISKNLGMIFSINTFVWFLFVLTAPRGSLDIILYDLVVVLCYFIIACMLIEYSVAVKLLKHFFEVINDTLINFTEKRHKAPNANYIFQRVQKLYHLRKLYSLLSDLSREISDFYSQPMLLCTVHIFMTLILTSYYCTKPLFTVIYGTVTFVSYFNCFLHALLNVTPLVILTKCISNTIAEVINQYTL